MPDYKCSIFFAAEARFPGQVPAGWSETYYRTETTLAAAVTALSTMTAIRAGFLAQPCTIIAMRVTQLGGNRISQLIPPSDYTYFNPDQTSDTAWQAALIHLIGDGGYSRPVMMRGIPDSIYNPETIGDVAQANIWKGLVAAWIAGELVLNQWKIYARNKDLVAAPQVPILSIQNSAPEGKLIVDTFAAHGLAVGDTVHLYNTGIRPPLGDRKVQTVGSATNFSVLGTVPADYETPISAYARKIAKVLIPITDGNFERVTHRDTGRPFGLQRGKRPQTA